MRHDPDSQTPAVLLVDDNPVNRRLGLLMLERLGCEVTSVADGPTALVAAAHGSYDLILMDVRMPEMDGLEATRRLREAGATMPIFAVTACPTLHDRETYRDAGMDGVLTKPVRLDDLRQLVGGVAARV